MTLCVLSGRDLRHVHHASNAGFLGGLGEDGSSLNDSGTDGVAKISSCDALKRRSDVIQVEKITEYDFGTQPLEPLRPVVLSMGQGSDMVPAGQYLLNGCPASVPGGSADQKCSPAHAWLPPEYVRCRRSRMKPTHRGRCDRRETAPELIDTQGASFLDDESEVMGQMLNRAVDHLAHGPIAAIANDSRPLPRFRW